MGVPTDPTITSLFHSQLLHQASLVTILALVLLVAWNTLRRVQLRKRAGGSEPQQTSRAAIPEPLARRILRFGFGALWVIDGLLQLQPGMPLGFASNVLQPGAASSPGWVQSLVGFGATTWSRHPTEAAAAVVWIQLGVGLFLLVAPRGRWSRGAGLVSAGWGLVVWAFGESFGGLFAPGLSILTGAPGGVVFYVVAGALLALPEEAWSRPKLGRVVTGSFGVFFLVMAVLQAWPGRGSWQGRVAGAPGTLAAQVRHAATASQPHALSSIVASFASFDEAHGAAVNLFVVVVLALIGAAFVSGRRLLPALIGLAVFAIADWVLVEDLGVFGGVGTDPNSMLPMLLLAAVGYVAMVRVPGPVSADLPRAEPASSGQAPVDPDQRRSWWEQVGPGYAAGIAGSLIAVVLLVVGTAPLVSAATDTSADTALAETFDGAPAVLDGPAPNFHLVDQYGRPVSLATLRGETVAMTFLDPVCTTDCPIIAQEFRQASQLVGAARTRFVAIVANPIFNSLADVRAFNRQEGLSSLSNWLFLTGSRSALEKAWNDFGASVWTAPAGAMIDHTNIAYVIDAQGRLRRGLNADPGPAAPADQSSFAALLAAQMQEVMH